MPCAPVEGEWEGGGVTSLYCKMQEWDHRRWCVGALDHSLTWNHSPLGRAGFMKAAKKMAVTASTGQATTIRIPWILVKAGRTMTSLAPTSPVNVAGFTLSSVIGGVVSWRAREPLSVCLFVCLYCILLHTGVGNTHTYRHRKQ